MKCLGDGEKSFRRRDLALIHIGKKQLGLDEENYRNLIREVGRVESGSSADLDRAGRIAVLTHMKHAGFRPVHKSAKASGMHFKPSDDRSPQLSKIGAILASLEYPWSYADGIAMKMFGVEKVRWLKSCQLQKILVALIYHQSRKNGEHRQGARKSDVKSGENRAKKTCWYASR